MTGIGAASAQVAASARVSERMQRRMKCAIVASCGDAVVNPRRAWAEQAFKRNKACRYSPAPDAAGVERYQTTPRDAFAASVVAHRAGRKTGLKTIQDAFATDQKIFRIRLSKGNVVALEQAIIAAVEQPFRNALVCSRKP
jgi:hypothetical protein